MSRMNWQRIRYDLIKGGVAPRFIERTLRELKAHYADLRNRAIREGDSEQQADQKARTALGDEQTLVAEIVSKPELRSFTARFPRSTFLFIPTLAAMTFLSVLGLVLFTLASSRSWFADMSADSTIFLWEKSIPGRLAGYQLLSTCSLTGRRHSNFRQTTSGTTPVAAGWHNNSGGAGFWLGIYPELAD